MLHIVRLIERRHPERSAVIVARLVLLSAAGLALGVGLLLLSR
jgi:hypothetical protein